MKIRTLIYSLLFLLSFLSPSLFAQEKMTTEEYHAKMKSSIYTLYKASNYQTFKMVSGQMRSIAEQEQTKWVPYYHATYAYVMAAFLSEEKFDAEELLNQGQMMIDKANEFSPNNSEIIALQGFLYQARIIVNPEDRAQKYAQKAVHNYDQARFINPENPRPYYLLGQILYRLPPKLGGNKTNACRHFQLASEKYESFKPRSEFSPNWGESGNHIMLEKCNQ